MMVKVEMMEVYGTGGMVGPKGSPHQYWQYKTSVMVKGSVKRAIKHAYKTLFDSQEDKEGFNWCLVLSEMKIYVNDKLVLERN